ncbi:hypothetical protein Tco_0105207 [Tanacetum coccineum]
MRGFYWTTGRNYEGLEPGERGDGVIVWLGSCGRRCPGVLFCNAWRCGCGCTSESDLCAVSYGGACSVLGASLGFEEYGVREAWGEVELGAVVFCLACSATVGLLVSGFWIQGVWDMGEGERCGLARHTCGQQSEALRCTQPLIKQRYLEERARDVSVILSVRRRDPFSSSADSGEVRRGQRASENRCVRAEMERCSRTVGVTIHCCARTVIHIFDKHDRSGSEVMRIHVGFSCLTAGTLGGRLDGFIENVVIWVMFACGGWERRGGGWQMMRHAIKSKRGGAQELREESSVSTLSERRGVCKKWNLDERVRVADSIDGVTIGLVTSMEEFSVEGTEEVSLTIRRVETSPLGPIYTLVLAWRLLLMNMNGREGRGMGCTAQHVFRHGDRDGLMVTSERGGDLVGAFYLRRLWGVVLMADRDGVRLMDGEFEYTLRECTIYIYAHLDQVNCASRSAVGEAENDLMTQTLKIPSFYSRVIAYPFVREGGDYLGVGSRGTSQGDYMFGS